VPSTNSAMATSAETELVIDLKDPYVAAFLAWLWPGAGHLYQRRWKKGTLFMVCILGTFIYGLTLGSCRVVYASMRENDKRWVYFCQLGIGLPAMPALVQAYRQNNNQEPFFDPAFMVPPTVVRPDNEPDKVSELNRNYHRYFDLGTLYTMIAGLLNVFAIFDAGGGPVFIEDKPPPQKDEKKTPPGS